jgi:hypothetical protein
MLTANTTVGINAGKPLGVGQHSFELLIDLISVAVIYFAEGCAI